MTLSACANGVVYDLSSTAAGTVPRVWPVIEEVGTYDTLGLDLEFETHPPLPDASKEEKPRVKSRWLRKQIKHRGHRTPPKVI